MRSMFKRQVLAVAVALVAIHPTVAFAATPCYVLVAVIVFEPAPSALIHRIVATGVRRFDDAGGGTESNCVPTASTAVLLGERAVLSRADSSGITPPLRFDRVVLRGISAEAVVGRFVAMAATARERSSRFTRVEIVSLAAYFGTEPQQASIPRQSQNERERERCVADNDELQRTNAGLRWLC